MTKRRNVLLAGFLWGAAARAARAATPAATEGDPLGSPQWPGLRREYTQDAPLRFHPTQCGCAPRPSPTTRSTCRCRSTPGRCGPWAAASPAWSSSPTATHSRSPGVRAAAGRTHAGVPHPAGAGIAVRYLVRTHDRQWHVGGAMVQAARRRLHRARRDAGRRLVEQDAERCMRASSATLPKAHGACGCRSCIPWTRARWRGCPRCTSSGLNCRMQPGSPGGACSCTSQCRNPLLTIEMPLQGPRRSACPARTTAATASTHRCAHEEEEPAWHPGRAGLHRQRHGAARAAVAAGPRRARPRHAGLPPATAPRSPPAPG